MFVHRVVCEAFHGPKPSLRHQAAHWNGIVSDNRAANLRWATPEENEADKVFHGVAVRGERHPLAKLREVDVVAIRAMLATGRFSRSAIAPLFGVSVAKIDQIARRRSWRHVA